MITWTNKPWETSFKITYDNYMNPPSPWIRGKGVVTRKFIPPWMAEMLQEDFALFASLGINVSNLLSNGNKIQIYKLYETGREADREKLERYVFDIFCGHIWSLAQAYFHHDLGALNFLTDMLPIDTANKPLWWQFFFIDGFFDEINLYVTSNTILEIIQDSTYSTGIRGTLSMDSNTKLSSLLGLSQHTRTKWDASLLNKYTKKDLQNWDKFILFFDDSSLRQALDIIIKARMELFLSGPLADITDKLVQLDQKIIEINDLLRLLSEGVASLPTLVEEAVDRYMNNNFVTVESNILNSVDSNIIYGISEDAQEDLRLTDIPENSTGDSEWINLD